MSRLSTTLKELRAQRKGLELEISKLDIAISALTKLDQHGGFGHGSANGGRRPLSVAARARIARAQRARWAEWRSQQKKKAA